MHRGEAAQVGDSFAEYVAGQGRALTRMYLDPADGHAVQYTQGWGGKPDFGSGAPSPTPHLNDYIIQLATTAAAHSGGTDKLHLGHRHRPPRQFAPPLFSSSP
jgi:hypothetical protein